jgi:hypothetical protein
MSGMTFNQVTTPLISLLKDVSGLAALYVILNAFVPNWADGLDLKSMRGMDSPGIFDYLENRNLILSAIGFTVAGVATGGTSWIAAIIGILAGQAVAETGEYAYKKIEGTSEGVGRTMFMFQLYMAAGDQGLIGDW